MTPMHPHPASLPSSAPDRAYDYERDPTAIYRQSFATIRDEVALAGLPDDLAPVAVRLIHACGMTDLMTDLVWSPQAVARGREAIAAGAPVFCDVEMVRHGIIRRYLPKPDQVICTLNDDRVPGHALALGTTRSAAAVDLWLEGMDGAVVAIGNAPTALFHLLERIAEGAPKPAVILGLPVGFVGAAESKAALAENPFDLAFLTLSGRRGGSALAAAAVNGLAAGLIEETLA
ncbi:precorrin-8X methylmutase [Roseibium aestuarii]|uniref:Precorrin-8X methylmutase n=1 Tax=Roseibium aestuarii TaxID=2600299 RepID=A0ABW4JU06_9HYPH|nr:precorrin-8X methylmutase [Roseibium aestuarii]